MMVVCGDHLFQARTLLFVASCRTAPADVAGASYEINLRCTKAGDRVPTYLNTYDAAARQTLTPMHGLQLGI